MTAAALSNSTSSTVCLPGSSSTTSPCTVPCCEIKVERCPGGCKIYCCCDDDAACTMLQNLCSALADGLCSVCCTRDGVLTCQCCFANCRCQCECTADGVCITCTSGDRDCCEMIQAMCDCLCCCQNCGCDCTVCFNGTPVCCCTC